MILRQILLRILRRAATPCRSAPPTLPTRTRPRNHRPTGSRPSADRLRSASASASSMKAAPTSVIMMNGHWNKRRIGQPDDDVIRFLRAREADRGLGELRQPDRHVDVGARKVDAPAAAVAVAILPERDAAELPRAVEVFGNGGPDVEPAAAAAAAPRRLRFTVATSDQNDEEVTETGKRRSKQRRSVFPSSFSTS